MKDNLFPCIEKRTYFKLVPIFLLIVSEGKIIVRKDAIPKNFTSVRDHIVKGMENKLTVLEASMKHVNVEMGRMELEEKEMRQTINDQKSILENMLSSLDSLKTSYTQLSKNFSDIQSMIHHDEYEKTFVISNDTCGETLVSRSGFISYRRKIPLVRMPSSGLYKFESSYYCIWPIQTDHRPTIKLKTHVVDPHANLKVVEIFEKTGNSNGPFPVRTRVTKLEPLMQYFFQGPVVFVVLHVRNATFSQPLSEFITYVKYNFEVQLQFDSVGNSVHRKTRFTITPLLGLAGKVTGEEIGDNIYTFENNVDEFTILFSNFSTETRLRLDYNGALCADGNFLYAIPNILDASSKDLVNYCKYENQTEFLTSAGQPSLIIINKLGETLYQPYLPFSVAWLADERFPSFSPSFNPECGGVISGSSGYFSYKPTKNGERCVWAIVPNIEPYSFVRISATLMNSNELGTSKASLFYMKPGHWKGSQRSPLTLWQNKTITNFTSVDTLSHEFFVIFESSLSETEIRLVWNTTDVGSSVEKQNADIRPQFMLVKGFNGSLTINNSYSSFPNTISYCYVIFNPVLDIPLLRNETLDLKLDYEPQDANKDFIDIYDLIGMENNGSNTVEKITPKPDAWYYEGYEPFRIKTVNGIGIMIILPMQVNSMPYATIHYEWEKVAVSRRHPR